MVVGVELVGLRFLRDGLGDGGIQLVASQRGGEVEFAMTAETGAEFTVGGETELVARRAEILLRQRTDETDSRTREIATFVVAGGAVAGALIGSQIARGAEQPQAVTRCTSVPPQAPEAGKVTETEQKIPPPIVNQ